MRSRQFEKRLAAMEAAFAQPPRPFVLTPEKLAAFNARLDWIRNPMGPFEPPGLEVLQRNLAHGESHAVDPAICHEARCMQVLRNWSLKLKIRAWKADTNGAV